MSVDFIKKGYGANELLVARRQQKQLSYFTQSTTQDDVSYLEWNAWVERKYLTNDYFLNWVKQVFRDENAFTFYKFLRFPLPTAKLVQDEIVPQLQRIFTAEDAYRRYTVKGAPIETPQELHFDKFLRKIFEAYLFRHNDIVFTDLFDVNKAFRQIVCIDKVVAIDCDDDNIFRIAFSAEYVDGDKEYKGYLYADSTYYKFYDKDWKLIKATPHDLGECPADFVSHEPFFAEKDYGVRKSIWSYVREELEEYAFLKTLLKMTEPNGAIPVVTMLQTDSKTPSGISKKGASPQEPIGTYNVGSQQSFFTNTSSPNVESQLQTGSVIKVHPIKDANGKLDMSVVTDYFKFHYIPTECLKYINTRIGEIRDSIIGSVVGQFKDNVNVAKNDKQINTGITNKQDNLQRLAQNISITITRSDYKFLAMQYGKDNVSVDVFLGTDFFLESVDSLYALLEVSPNPLESRSVLERVNKNKYRYNPSMGKRTSILYKIMPFAIDKDFDKACNLGIIDAKTKYFQLKFNYCIDFFEAEYGDILAFWNDKDYLSDKEKIVLITNLITSKIVVNEKTVDSTPSITQG